VNGSSVVGAGNDRRWRGTARLASSVVSRCSDMWSSSAWSPFVMSRSSRCLINGDSGGCPVPTVVAHAVAAGAVADGDGAAAIATDALSACSLSSIAAGKGGVERLGSASGTMPENAEACSVGPTEERAHRGRNAKPPSRGTRGGSADTEECWANKGGGKGSCAQYGRRRRGQQKWATLAAGSLGRGREADEM